MDEKIEKTRVDAAPVDPCNGCHDCALRCSAGVPMTHMEFERIIEYLGSIDDPDRAMRILDQNKETPWFEDIYRECCLFLDIVKLNCLIYPVRPLICRLFGRVEWLPCPAGKEVSQLPEGWDVIRNYSKEKRQTFAEWQMETGLFDFRMILKK